MYHIPYFPLFVGNILVMLWAISMTWYPVGRGGLLRVATWILLVWGCFASLQFFGSLAFGHYATCDGCSALEDMTSTPAPLAWFSDLIILSPMVALWCYVTALRWGMKSSTGLKYAAITLVAGPQVSFPALALAVFDAAEADSELEPDNSIMPWSEYVYIAASLAETLLWLPQFLAFAMDHANCWLYPLGFVMWDLPATAWLAQSISLTGWFSEVWAIAVLAPQNQWMWFFPFGLLGFHNIVVTCAVVWVIAAWYECPQGAYIRALLARPKFDLSPVVGALTTLFVVAAAAGSAYIALDVSPVFGVATAVGYAGVALMSPFGAISSWHAFGAWIISRPRRTLVFFVSVSLLLAGSLAHTSLAPTDLAMTIHKLLAIPVLGSVLPFINYVAASYSFWAVVSWTPHVGNSGSDAPPPEDAFAYFFKAVFTVPVMLLAIPCPIPLVSSIITSLFGSSLRPLIAQE